MADYPFLLGAAFKAQSTRGTATTMETIGNGAAIDNTTDGAVLGDPSGGEGETGISLTIGKNYTDKAVQTGSYTRDFGNYIGRTIDEFSMVIPLKGNGATASSPPVDGDMVPDGGITALFNSAGLDGNAWGSGVGHEFTPLATALSTAAVYVGGEGGASPTSGTRVVIKDVEASGLTFDFTPGEVATASFDLTGVLEEVTAPATWDTTPFDYGNQSTLSAPAVESVGFTWLARTLGFSTLSIAFDNQTESVPSSNTAGGSVPRQTGREITITGTLDGTDADYDFEYTELANSLIGSATQLTFTVGTAATNGSTVNAYTIDIPTPECTSVKAVPLGNSQAYEITWIARSTTANGEFSLIYI